MSYEIKKEKWHTCKITGAKIKDLAKIYGGSGIYYSEVFEEHLKQSCGLTPLEYFELYDNRPSCKCGCGKPCPLNKKPNFKWREYSCGRYPGLIKWSKDAKITRAGKGNPMYGKRAWNKGKTKETNDSIAKMSEAQKGKKISDESKQKMSEAAKKRTVHGHTGHKHSKKNKEAARQRALQMLKNGKFKQTKTAPHLAMLEILESLNWKFEEEAIVDCWSFDFYVPHLNIYIEVDGDYWHSNPRLYPDGPQTKGQKINWYRDQKKNEFVKDNNITLLRFWECDILNNKKEIECKLKRLSQ